MTAVEWYIKKIKEARQMCDDTSMEMDIWHTLDVLIEKGEQAKEMEKQQLECAWNSSDQNMRFQFSSSAYKAITFKQWLEKFKQEKQ